MSKKVYLEVDTKNKLIVGDCVEVMRSISTPFINLTLTSPPYNVDLGNDYQKQTVAYDIYKDNLPYKEYLDFLKERFTEIYRLTKDFGRLAVNIGDQKNGAVPTTNYLFNILVDIGWIPYTKIVWNKKQVNPRTAWGSFQSPKQPSFPTPFEYILIFAKGGLNLNRKGISDLTKDEFIKYSLSLWEMAPAKKSITNHPAAFPDELAYRVIKMFSYVGDQVFDPFCGSGTTCRIANQLGRVYTGIDISESYIDNIKI